MEQWNKENSNKSIDEIEIEMANQMYREFGMLSNNKISLYRWAERRYIQDVLEEHGINGEGVENLQMLKEILEQAGIDSEEYLLQAKNKKHAIESRLFSCMDAFIGKEKRMLLKNDQGQYQFDDMDVWFLDSLMELYKSDLYKIICKKEYYNIQIEDYEIIHVVHYGFKRMAFNKENKLSIDDLEIEWCKRFSPQRIALKKEIERFYGYVNYYCDVVLEGTSDNEFLRQMRNVLNNAEEKIVKIGNEAVNKQMTALPEPDFKNIMTQKKDQ